MDPQNYLVHHNIARIIQSAPHLPVSIVAAILNWSMWNSKSRKSNSHFKTKSAAGRHKVNFILKLILIPTR